MPWFCWRSQAPGSVAWPLSSPLCSGAISDKWRSPSLVCIATCLPLAMCHPLLLAPWPFSRPSSWHRGTPGLRGAELHFCGALCSLPPMHSCCSVLCLPVLSLLCVPACVVCVLWLCVQTATCVYTQPHVCAECACGWCYDVAGVAWLIQPGTRHCCTYAPSRLRVAACV